MFNPTILTVVTIQDLQKVRPFTLTSGYDQSNTQFVRVKDGYSVQADPALVKKRNQDGSTYLATHHVCYEGYLYRCHPGYVLATLKGGNHGWSEVAEVEDGWVTFNPWEDKKVLFRLDNTYNLVIEVTHISTGKEMYPEREVKEIGQWSLFNGSVRLVKSPIFKGLRNLLQRLRFRPEQFNFHYGGYSFSSDLTQYYDLGEVVTSKQPLTLEDIFFNFNKYWEFSEEKETEVYSKKGVNFKYIVSEDTVYKCYGIMDSSLSTLDLKQILGLNVFTPTGETKELSEGREIAEGWVKTTMKVVIAYPKKD